MAPGSRAIARKPRPSGSRYALARVPGLLSRTRELVRDLWGRAKREHSSPREVGLSVGVGAFIACTPLVGFHIWLALGLATILKLNRLWAMIGSRLSTTPVFLVTTFAEIQLAHHLRTGGWIAMSVRQALARGPELVLDWALGSVIVGAVVATIAGLVAAALARRWEALNPRGLAALRQPSSESPQ
jgi:uncharacterized protein (DUF2062 family)